MSQKDSGTSMKFRPKSVCACSHEGKGLGFKVGFRV